MNDLTVSKQRTDVTIGAMASSDQQRAIAEVHAAITLAKANPRDVVRATDNIQNAFTRIRLAEQAQYQYSKGGSDVTGPSIRSAEAIAQLWGNMQFGFRELSRGVDADGVGFSEVEAFAWDVESNTKRPTQFRVRHWRDTRNGGYKISEEREIYELCANMAQRRVRACILAVIPGDVVDVAMMQAEATLKSRVNVTPELISSLIESFAAIGVSKSQIEGRIQRRIEAIQPAQVVALKRIRLSISDGMSAPEDWFAADGQSGEISQPKRKAKPESQGGEEGSEDKENPPANEAGESAGHPAQTSESAAKLPENKRNLVIAKLKAAGLSTTDLKKKLGKGVDELAESDFAAALAFIANPME